MSVSCIVKIEYGNRKLRVGSAHLLCRVCERQCANEVHTYDADGRVMLSDETKCVELPKMRFDVPDTHALKIVQSDCAFRKTRNWPDDTIKRNIQASRERRRLCSSLWATHARCPFTGTKYSQTRLQVTNPSIDPLREPMETKVFFGQKPAKDRE